jgi:leukotriene-A4 hydrolase
VEALLGRQDLEKEIATLEDKDEMLHVDLKGRDPDAGFTDVPYQKGALFLRELEEVFGRSRFDEFLRGYFNHFAFQSITTADFLKYLARYLLQANPGLAARVPIEEWVYQPGVPTGAPRPRSDAFAEVEKQANQWLENKLPALQLQTKGWTTQEWLHFLRTLPQPLGVERMRLLDDAFRLTRSGNSEIADQWLLMAIRNHYKPAYPRLQEFLTSIGRRKLVKPLYEELVKTADGKELAMAIYSKARPTYHPIVVATIDDIVKGEKRQQRGN